MYIYLGEGHGGKGSRKKSYFFSGMSTTLHDVGVALPKKLLLIPKII